METGKQLPATQNNNLQNSTKTIMLLRGDEIVKFERKVSLPEIVRSNEPSIIKLKNDDYDSLYDYAVACALGYLKICYPNQVSLAPVIAADLIETRLSWKAADFINLFKFLRQRQDIEALRVFGNQMTMPKFMELVSVYEDHRSDEFEKFKQEERGKHLTENKTLNPLAEKLAIKMRAEGHEPTGDEKLGKMMDLQRLKSEKNGYGKNVTKPQDHKIFFEKI